VRDIWNRPENFTEAYNRPTEPSKSVSDVTLKTSLQGSKQEKTTIPESKTDSGFPVKPVYMPEDTASVDFPRDVSRPGEYPFTRGIYPTMYRERLWTMRQYAGFGSAEETNRRFKFLVSQGQTGLSIAFDLPTQLGFDSDHPRAEGEIGRVGVPISSLKDMETLFSGIKLDQVSTSMTINATAPVLLAMYIAVGDLQGVSRQLLRGTTQNEILKEYSARNTYIFPPGPSMKLAVDLIEYCSQELPKWYPISISGYHMREAGSTAIQEIAFTLGNAIAYVDECQRRGLKVDHFAPRLSFFFNCSNDLLEEVAKFRAARRLWARVMKERYHAVKPESMMMRFHVQTSGQSLTAQQPENNIIRVTLQALAAVLGGAQSLHTCSRDEALSLPTEESVKIALRSQQIIAYESGITRTVDPLGGSFYLEALTSELEDAAGHELKRIEDMGGMVKAIELGHVQREIQKSAYDHQKAVEEQKKIIVGVNKFAENEKLEIGIHRVTAEMTENQLQRLKKVKATRDQQQVSKALQRISDAASQNENLMPHIIEAVKNYCTTGEISDALRAVYGEYRAPANF
jgi:methylmalonyl-CoA mutase N-terminal domain/subunit